jgi:hypothetical protein
MQVTSSLLYVGFSCELYVVYRTLSCRGVVCEIAVIRHEIKIILIFEFLFGIVACPLKAGIF